MRTLSHVTNWKRREVVHVWRHVRNKYMHFFSFWNLFLTPFFFFLSELNMVGTEDGFFVSKFIRMISISVSRHNDLYHKHLFMGNELWLWLRVLQNITSLSIHYCRGRSRLAPNLTSFILSPGVGWLTIKVLALYIFNFSNENDGWIIVVECWFKVDICVKYNNN